MRHRMLRRQRDRAVERRDGLVAPPQAADSLAQVDPDSGILRMQRDGLPQRRGGFIPSAALLEQRAQKIQHIRVLRLLRQQAAINRLRLGQPAGAMIEKSLLTKLSRHLAQEAY